MSTPLEIFTETSQIKAKDVDTQKIVSNNIAHYNKAVQEGKQQYANIELAKTRAAGIKHKVINNLDKYLIEWEAAFIKRGGKVIWAQDSEEAVKEVLAILTKINAKTVVKSKSMTTEEINLNSEFEKQNIQSIETDLGEYIVQLRKEAPYHIVTPAMHLSKQEVAKTFHETKKTEANLTPEQITEFVRQELRVQFPTADAGITGANFLIAETGSIVITENEGNAMMTASFPRVHIAFAGIEKIIPSLNDLDLFLPLLATHATGQQLSVYNTIYTGPKQPDELDGPEEMYVILLDGGRSALLEEVEQREALTCIRCGACANACPVYKTIGGHAFGTTYGGPIGSIISPYLKGIPEYKHLSDASTICGSCTTVCPVKIDLHRLIQLNRSTFVEKGHTTKADNWMWFLWKNNMLKRSKMEKGGQKLKSFMLKQFFRKLWGEDREFPTVAPKSFNQIWREKKGIR